MVMAIFTIEGEEIIDKKVGNGGDSGRIYLPNEWIGETVKVVRLSRVKEKDAGDQGVKEVQGEQGDKGVELAKG